MTQHRPESDQQIGCAADTHRALSDWKPTRRKYIRSGQFLLKSIDLLRIVFMRISLKSMRRLWKRQEKGNEKKTMIETRRGREREAEEEAEVRKQGGIGGGRSWRKAKGRGINSEERKEAKVEEIMRESWEDYERVMRISMGRRARKNGSKHVSDWSIRIQALLA